MIEFEYINGTKEQFDSYRVTPYTNPRLRAQNPTKETIAEALEKKKAWLILPEKEGELERIINPHQIKSISKD